MSKTIHYALVAKNPPAHKQGMFVDESRLQRGIYFTSNPKLHSIGMTLSLIYKEHEEELINERRKKNFLKNLHQCKLVKVVLED